ncbi:TetR/AcrR family transcriptional regulator [Paracoccus caeni]|uniref:TetR/AcrR family transcriptional regulator n=1 Tax=Paracoccus caeni TaxID=657651 RepID=A0A934VY19_9RHOB|nr:TetR/AcrR family transcriptional regulator [Paracoccus caeni]MBK4214305.1 TetR/AcrR family transcriptional regulator [Paracoccus caeni]
MIPDKNAPPRGRPPTITRERIADAGIKIGLPDLTVIGVAAHLGVSHMGLYKHISGLDELRQIVAEAIFLRWQFPPPIKAADGSLESYLTTFAESIWSLVEAHPGVAPYLLRGDMITRAMIDKIVAHQEEMTRICGITFAQSRWLLLTIAFHCVAVADTVLPKIDMDCNQDLDRPDGASAIHAEHRNGIRALIVGSLAILDEITTIPYPVEATMRYES